MQGRDGFGLHLHLRNIGIENEVVGRYRCRQEAYRVASVGKSYG